MADLQGFKRIASVGLILLYQEVFTAPVQTCLDAAGDIQTPFTNFGKFDEAVHLGIHLHYRLHIGHIQTALWLFESANTEVLQMQQTDSACVLPDELYRIFTAVLNPMGVQFKAHILSIVLDDIQQILTIVTGELKVMIMVIQINAMLLQLTGVLIGTLGKVDGFIEAEHILNGHGTNAHHIAI